MIGGLQTISQITSTEGKPLVYIPLTVILTIAMIKELMEDNKRKKSDNFENKTKTQLCQKEKFNSIEWEKLRVGDIIKVI